MTREENKQKAEREIANLVADKNTQKRLAEIADRSFCDAWNTCMDAAMDILGKTDRYFQIVQILEKELEQWKKQNSEK